jgi:hypothetical protein
VVHKALREPQVLRVLLVRSLSVHVVLTALKVLPVFKVPQVLRTTRRVHVVHKALREPQVLKVARVHF